MLCSIIAGVEMGSNGEGEVTDDNDGDDNYDGFSGTVGSADSILYSTPSG